MSGPVINDTVKNFTTRDSLGIESVATTISREICPIVNTVTPRPFYWALMDWCFYDWYSHFPDQQKREFVYKYIRKINYFIALGNILANGRYVENSFTGSQKAYDLFKDGDSFSFNEDYLTGIGAMGYYPAGLDTMEMVVTRNVNTLEVYKEPHIREKDGGLLAKAFDKIISTTAFYKYRFSKSSIPKDVLIELGQKINIDLKGFDECKQILKENLFEKKSRYKLADCKDYINYVKSTYSIDLDTNSKCRNVFFDYFSPRSLNRSIPENLREISNEWEIVVGRQYLTTGLEVLWKHMIKELKGLLTIEEWVDSCISDSSFSFDINEELASVIKLFNYDFETRERIINEERLLRPIGENSIENALKIMLSVYNRFYDREDLNRKYYHYGDERASISFDRFFNAIEDHKNKPISEFIIYVMKEFLIKQHLRVAFNKMLENRDGYYIEEVDGRYMQKSSFNFDFQGIRMVQLYSVMSDLDLLNG